MATTTDGISDSQADWIARQPMFFVGTAPLSGDGHVNVSPKGPGETLRVLGPNEVAYLDFTGSGAETIAHLRENGRIVLMWCAFDGPPMIVRLHGRGEVVWEQDERFAALVAGFDEPRLPREALRAVIRVDVERVTRSCGYTVPRMDFVEERDQMPKWTRKQLSGGARGLDEYRAVQNATSIDGLPSVPLTGGTR
jgi:predicted pyridoxine 5'-phosphate oxidase superfamily flavin-nucleotide-binding protein